MCHFPGRKPIRPHWDPPAGRLGAYWGWPADLSPVPKALPYGEILASLQRVRREFPAKQIHVFGIGGTATLHLAALLGVNSVDSSGWRNRAARGIVQLPGSGDRVVGNLGKWRGRIPSEEEWATLKACQCAACLRYSLGGLQENGIRGFCNRATHNLYVLLEEAAWLKQELNAGTYRQSYRSRLDNSAYLPLIESVLALALEGESPIAVGLATSLHSPG